MQFMLIVSASENSEQGGLPPQELREAMDCFNEKLLDAGVRVMARGLYPTSDALRIRFEEAGAAPVISKGPFYPPEAQIAGFIIIDVASEQEAVRWAMAMPDPQGYGAGQIELRKIF